jgi:hypothetical protein
MGSVAEEFRRREAAARAEADGLRSRIEELAEGLARRKGRSRGWRSPGRKSRGAAEFAAAAGLATDKAKVEGQRSKLKLLAGRGWLAGEPGGLFARPDHARETAKPGRYVSPTPVPRPIRGHRRMAR